MWAWVITGCVVVLLLLPMPVAERFTSPTQDGQYLTNPARSYQFAFAATRASTEAKLGRSGRALEEAQRAMQSTPFTVTKVELLFFPQAQAYDYVSHSGQTLQADHVHEFAWEIWGLPADGVGVDDQPDVIGLLDYQTGELLASLAAND